MLISLVLTGAVSTAQAASPNINVGTMFDYMEPGKSQLLKRVRNSGDATAYVRVEISQVHFSAADEIVESPVDTAAIARSDAGASGLMASPSRLIIPAQNGQQATRLIYRGDRSSEMYYRVRYVPVVPNNAEFSLTEEQVKQYEEAVGARVNIMTGYGTLVFVPPTHARYDTQINGHVVSNRGNATVVLNNVRQCVDGKLNECSKGVKIHLRPGQVRDLGTPDSGQVLRYQLIEGLETREIGA
ncbi:CS1 fimbrial subunit B flags: Precursor [Stenotrophomonas indicatrix]|uniref:CS1 fimbrial subunit B flags: Precursor n=1 Tax=Stenotrophomonas indicatrix TaxID=2045451 RepID=UPI003009E1B2